jgi:hypothetical protein
MHLDCILLRNIEEMNAILDENYGYIGAPWFNEQGGLLHYKYILKGMHYSKIINWICRPRICSVGNGGLSLRNCPKIISLISRNEKSAAKWHNHEDIFFSYFGQDEEGFLPSVEIAKQFALESDMKEKIENGCIPFGVHSWKSRYPELIDKVFIGD